MKRLICGDVFQFLNTFASHKWDGIFVIVIIESVQGIGVQGFAGEPQGKPLGLLKSAADHCQKLCGKSLGGHFASWVQISRSTKAWECEKAVETRRDPN